MRFLGFPGRSHGLLLLGIACAVVAAFKAPLRGYGRDDDHQWQGWMPTPIPSLPVTPIWWPQQEPTEVPTHREHKNTYILGPDFSPAPASPASPWGHEGRRSWANDAARFRHRMTPEVYPTPSTRMAPSKNSRQGCRPPSGSAAALPLPAWYYVESAVPKGAGLPWSRIARFSKEMDACQSKVEKILASHGGDWSKLSGSEKARCSNALFRWNEAQRKVERLLSSVKGSHYRESK